MKTLHLTLKKKWFDMIASGEKKEEYREIKWFWLRRLTNIGLFPPTARIEIECKLTSENYKEIFKEYKIELKNFDIVQFKNGYAKDSPTVTVELKGIEISTARPEWSDNWQGNLFIIKLGEIIN